MYGATERQMSSFVEVEGEETTESVGNKDKHFSASIDLIME